MQNHKKYTISQASIRLGISKSTLRRWVKRGKILSAVDEKGRHVFSEETLQHVVPPKNVPKKLIHAKHHLLSPAQAAHRMGISKSTLLRYEQSGLIRASRTVHGARRYKAADIEELISSHAPYQSIPNATVQPPDIQTPPTPTPTPTPTLTPSVLNHNETTQNIPNPPPEPLPISPVENDHDTSPSTIGSSCAYPRPSAAIGAAAFKHDFVQRFWRSPYGIAMLVGVGLLSASALLLQIYGFTGGWQRTLVSLAKEGTIAIDEKTRKEMVQIGRAHV